MSSTAWPGSPARTRSVLLLSAVLAACGEAPPDVRARGEQTASFPPPECEVVGYPCTWGEVAEEVVNRGDALGEIGMRLLLGGGSPDDVARLLENASSVADVLRFGQRVRFRLKGGRPMWISPPWELDHHRPDAAAGQGREIASEESLEPVQSRSLWHHLLRLSHRLGPRPLLAASIAPRGQTNGKNARVTGQPGSGKKARVLAPFEWEFPEYGNNFARRVRLIRDYRQKAGGAVELYANLREFDDNPDDPGSGYRTAGGETLLRGEVDVDDFLGWDDYHLVIVATHGTREPCPWVLRKDLPDRKSFDTYVEYLEAIPAGVQCPSVWAGRALREDYAGYPGVEVDAFRVRRDEPNDDLTPAEAAECVQLVEAGENQPQTSEGTPCLQIGIGDKKVVVLTFAFFQWAYEKGLSDAVVFVAACRSGLNRYLLDQLTGARGGGSNTAVAAFGFEQTVNYADGFAVVDSLIKHVDAGYHSRELLRRLQAMPRITSMVGRALAPDDDLLPAHPSAILGEERAATHARDVVLLVDPASGEELQDSATVLVLGAAGDGKPDSLYLRPRIIGVAPSDPVDQVRLAVTVQGSGSGARRYAPDDRVEAGVHQYDGDVELGRDFTEGEVVDLEIRADLPGGGESRWVYHGIRLRSSYWRAAVGLGRFPGTFSGWRGKANLMGTKLIVTLESDPDQRPSVLVNISLGDRPLGAPVSVGMCQVEVAFSPSGNPIADLQANRAANVCSGGPAPDYPPAATVEVQEIREGWVVGWAEGVFFRGYPHPPDPAERGQVRIDFRVPLCRGFGC